MKKKTIFTLLITFGIFNFLISSCSSNNPERVAKEFCTAMNNMDYDKAMSLSCRPAKTQVKMQRLGIEMMREMDKDDLSQLFKSIDQSELSKQEKAMFIMLESAMDAGIDIKDILKELDNLYFSKMKILDNTLINENTAKIKVLFTGDFGEESEEIIKLKKDSGSWKVSAAPYFSD